MLCLEALLSHLIALACLRAFIFVVGLYWNIGIKNKREINWKYVKETCFDLYLFYLFELKIFKSAIGLFGCQSRSVSDDVLIKQL